MIKSSPALLRFFLHALGGGSYLQEVSTLDWDHISLVLFFHLFDSACKPWTRHTINTPKSRDKPSTAEY